MLHVTCALIQKDQKLFIARRAAHKSMAGKWEFPGGKVEPGETEPQSLKRELMEEFGMQVAVGQRLGEHVHAYPDFTIRLVGYSCRFIKATFKLTDHDAFKWVSAKQLGTYDMAAADRLFIKAL